MFDKINALYRAIYGMPATWKIEVTGCDAKIAANGELVAAPTIEKAVEEFEKRLISQAGKSIPEAAKMLQRAEEKVKSLREDLAVLNEAHEAYEAAKEEMRIKEERERIWGC